LASTQETLLIKKVNSIQAASQNIKRELEDNYH
jgi:hypothetical protein